MLSLCSILFNAQRGDTQGFIKKVSVFLVIVSTGLLSALPEIQAQQTTAPQTMAAPFKSIALDALKARRAAIENRKDIDATLKANCLKYLDWAIADLNLAADFNRKKQEISELIKPAPARLKMLHAELKEPVAALDTIEKQAQQMDIALLEQRLSEEKAGLAIENARLQEWKDRLSSEKDTIIQAAAKRVFAADRLDEIQRELATLKDVTEADIVNDARILQLKSEWEKLRAENNLNALRQQSHNLFEVKGMKPAGYDPRSLN